MRATFSSVFEECDLNLGDLHLPSLPPSSINISSHDVGDVLRRLKKGSPGPDGIPFWIFRDHYDLLTPAVHHICSLSLTAGIFPDLLKSANVIPIPKQSKGASMEYRPISLLPTLSKVLEKIVLRKFLPGMIPGLGPRQFAFIPRQGQGTVSALTYIVNKILSHLDTPGAVRLLMIDYSKAFDKLSHKSIIDALASLKAPVQLCSWIKSYLYLRKQRVKINDNFSEWYVASSGVPQGGVLSPFLFAVTVNDLEASFENSLLVKFADDMCILHFVRSLNNNCLSEEFQRIKQWSSKRGLHINCQKTKLMDFITKKSIKFPPLIDIDSNCTVEVVSQAKLLGLILDDKLSWVPHLEDVVSKVRKRMFFLHTLKQIKAPEHIFRSVYTSLIRSVSSYAYPAWCNIGYCAMKKLVSLERRVGKMFNFAPTVAFDSFCEQNASRLAEKALDPDHPLHCIFDHKASRFSARRRKSHRKVLAKTCRFGNSFIRFA